MVEKKVVFSFFGIEHQNKRVDPNTVEKKVSTLILHRTSISSTLNLATVLYRMRSVDKFMLFGYLRYFKECR